jgi:hypothetical protein
MAPAPEALRVGAVRHPPADPADRRLERGRRAACGGIQLALPPREVREIECRGIKTNG